MEFIDKLNLKKKTIYIMLILERIRDYASFFISIVSSYIYFTNGDFKTISHFIAMYLITDFFINKKVDLYIHHIIGLILYTFMYMNNSSSGSEHIFMKPFIAVEISSVFYNIKFLYPKNYFSTVNDLLFIVTFFYYRIYRYYDVMINNDITDMIENTGSVMKYFYYSAVYNLYALNMYWFSHILKIILKKLR